MCRIAGYLGRPTTLDTLLLEPERSLREQAHRPRELPPGVVGSDGFGFGWFAEHDGQEARFRSVLPIWVDENITSIAPHVRSASFVASSRTATRAMPVSVTNTPPFLAGDALLVHNGAIHDFHARVMEPLRGLLSTEARVCIVGNTDTEYLAALVARRRGSLEDRVRAMLDDVTRRVREAGTTAQLDVIVVERECLVAARYAVDDRAPSLYARIDGNDVAVASEAMEESGWTEVEPGTLLVARIGSAPVFAKL